MSDRDTAAAVRAWVETWERAWPAQDADAIAALYAEDAVYRSHPFREPYRGTTGALDYVRTAFAAEERPAEATFGTPVVDGDRAAVEYWATLVYEGREQTLAGVSLLRFDNEGRCAEHRDYWTLEPGRREPPSLL